MPAKDRYVRSLEIVPGYLYAMKSVSFPDLYKVGWSGQPETRRVALSGSGTPDPFAIVLAFPVKDAKRAEAVAFSLLHDVRYNDRKEFFQCDFQHLVSILTSVQRHINVGAELNTSFISEDEIDRLQSRDF